MRHPLHCYRITYRRWNRTTRRMARHLATAYGTSRWSALRAWWRVERQWQNPVVEVLSIEPNHVGCPQMQYSTHWEYTCALAPTHE